MTFPLPYGLGHAVPDAVGAAWGARLIYPDDLLHDRQGGSGPDMPALGAWLNGGALRAALTNARKLDAARPTRLSRDGSQRVILHRDAQGVIVASPQTSHGYLYIAAWLHHEAPELQPGADFT